MNSGCFEEEFKFAGNSEYVFGFYIYIPVQILLITFFEPVEGSSIPKKQTNMLLTKSKQLGNSDKNTKHYLSWEKARCGFGSALYDRED